MLERDDAVALLARRPKFGTGLGLQRMQAIVAGLRPALWSANGRAIHVAGSQGKGTVTMLAGALLGTLGYKTGQFLSPHLMRFEERIVIGGAPIGADALAQAAQSFAAREEAYLAVNPNDRFGSFEAVTAAAFEAFTAADIDVAVIEAGIGGRFDATRAARGAIMALTGIDQEHAALLGPTEEHILYDKADLCPAGGLIVAGLLPPELKRRLSAYGTIRGFHCLHMEDVTEITQIRHGSEGATADLTVDGLALDALSTHVFGLAQLRNIAVALLLVRAWLERKGAAASSAQLAEAARIAFAQTRLPLRFERIAEDPVTIADVAHTPQAAQALAAAFDAVFPGQGFVLLAGIADDKPAHAILAPLLARAAAIICTRSYRGLPSEMLATIPPAKAGRSVTAIENPPDAFAAARAAAKNAGCPLLVTGSLFLAAEAKCIAAGGDPAALEFL